MKKILFVSLLAFASCKKCEHCDVIIKSASNGVAQPTKYIKDVYCDDDLKEVKKMNGKVDYGNGTYIETIVDCR